MSKLDTLWYTRCSVPTPTGIAVQLGWIEQELGPDGIKLDSVLDHTSRDVRESHYDHKLDFSFRQGGSIPAIWAKAAGRDTRLVGLTWTPEAQVILTLPGSGVRSVKALRRRRLGVVTRPKEKIDFWHATTLRAYQLALATEGLALADVELVELQRPDSSFDVRRPAEGRLDRTDDLVEVRALREGRVDAIFHKGSHGLQLADEIGALTIFDLGKHPATRARANNHSPRTLTVDGRLADEHPDVVARIVRRVVQAGQWAADHRGDAIALLARETRTPERFVTDAYGDVHEHLRTELDERSLDALAELTTFLAEFGFIPRNFDVRAWADPRPLEAARRAIAARPRTSDQPVAPATI